MLTNITVESEENKGQGVLTAEVERASPEVNVWCGLMVDHSSSALTFIVKQHQLETFPSVVTISNHSKVAGKTA